MTNIITSDFEHEDRVVQIGVAPRRIDLVTSISGVTYEEAKANSVEHEIDGVRLRILSKPDFIRNKLASGRPKDIADAKLLQKRRQ